MEEVEVITYNSITHPSYYSQGRAFEPVNVIKDWELNFNLGNVVKYVARAGRKIGEEQSALTDLLKARSYLDFEIKHLQNEELKNG